MMCSSGSRRSTQIRDGGVPVPIAAGFTHARALHLLPFLWCKTDPVSRQRAEGGGGKASCYHLNINIPKSNFLISL